MERDTFSRPNDQRNFIHKKILGLGGKLLGAATNLLPGPVGAVARGALGVIRGRQRPPRPIFRGKLPAGSRTQFPTPGRIGSIQRFLPGGSSGFTTIPRSLLPQLPESGPMRKNRMFGINVIDPARAALQGGDGDCPGEPRVCAPRGFHLNKSSYFLRDGSFVERGTKFVRNRRLNNANGRAQGRAITRLEKGADNAKKLLKATGYRTVSKQSSRELRMRRRGHR